jgi:hypothetical protein
MILRTFDGEWPSLPGSTIVSASELELPSAPPSSSLGRAPDALGLLSLRERSGLAALDNLVTVEGLGRSESLPGRLGEAAGFVEAGSAAFCASMSFISKDNYRFAPSWSPGA